MNDWSRRSAKMDPFVKAFGLSPFMPEGVLDSGKRYGDFYKAIRPVWEPIVLAAHEAVTDKEVGTINELEVLHACDIAILASGIKVDRSTPYEQKLGARKGRVVDTLKQSRQAIGGIDRAAGAHLED